MLQEPKSRQYDSALIFEITVLNQTFLSALASLGSYIRNHPTTAPSGDFETTSQAIDQNLQNSINILEGNEIAHLDRDSLDDAREKLEQKFHDLSAKRDREIEAGKLEIDKNMRLKLQEARLVIDQVSWLLELSEKLKESLSKLKS